MLHSKHTAESLLGTSVLQVAEFIANGSSNKLSPFLREFSIGQSTNGFVWGFLLHNLPEFI